MQTDSTVLRKSLFNPFQTASLASPQVHPGYRNSHRTSPSIAPEMAHTPFYRAGFATLMAAPVYLACNTEFALHNSPCGTVEMEGNA